MRGYTRHQLKQDRFAEATKETVSWAVEHQTKLVAAGVIVGVALLVVLGSWYYFSVRDQSAGEMLARALRTYQAQLRPPNTPADPNTPSFTSAAERAKAANAEFRAIVESYGRTNSGHVARYFEALTYRDMGDMPAAERELKTVAGYRNPDLASQAKLALAGLYRDTGRDQEAIQLYNELIKEPTGAVGKATAELELAALYEAKQPGEARRIYEQIRKEEPASAAAELAGNRLANLK